MAVASTLAAAQAAEALRFVDRSDALPVDHRYTGGWEHFVGGGVAAFDCNGDGFPELAVAGGTSPARLFLNQADAPGAQLSFASGPFPELTGVTGIWPLDIDGDARLDLAVLRVGGNLFLRGLGDCRFEDATDRWGVDPGDAWSTAFSATWEPGQAWPTLAIGNYVDRADPDGPFGTCDANLLLRPSGAGYAAPIRLEPGHCALSALFSDWQRRGRADLRLSNDRHYYVRDGSEQMWRMDPLRQLGPADGFDPVSIWGMGIASADITGDGRPDVVLTSMGDQLLMLSDPGGYVAAPWEMGTYATRPHLGDDGRPATGWHAEFGDIDNDGRLDLFIAKGNVDQMPENAMADPNNLLMQMPDGRFVERSVEAGVASMARSRGAALVDLNGDGRLDLVVVNRRAPMELWQNASDAGAWLAVTLRQKGSNAFAVGAWLELRLPDGRVLAREVTVGGGHGGGQAGPVHFGLGPVAAVEVRVIWPDGAVSDWVPLSAGHAVELWRGPDGGLVIR
ncbi:MAG: CRTAC1 family protein [Pseudomonadota bacterium]